jgi:hypothetical protein
MLYTSIWYRPSKLNFVAWVREELYWPRGLRLSAKLVPTFADSECHVVRVANPFARNLVFFRPVQLHFFLAAPKLYSRGWVDPVPDPLLLRKSRSPENQTRDFLICSQELWPLDHRSGRYRSRTMNNASIALLLGFAAFQVLNPVDVWLTSVFAECGCKLDRSRSL